MSSQYNHQNLTPNPFTLRSRLNSMNSPFISPLRIFHSPITNQNESLFDSQLRHQNFQLEPSNLIQNRVSEDANDSESDSKFQYQEQPLDLTDLSIDENNILTLALKYVNKNESALKQIILKISKSGDKLLLQIFEYLLTKFRKLRKTKEQMIKYSMRKAFRFIADQLKKQMPNYAIDNNQYLQFYFLKHQKDQNITVPFKKQSLEKTMNAAFLKKIFSCDKFLQDYMIFLKNFKKQYMKDNDKKVELMNQAIINCYRSKSLKGLDTFKRLPWTTEILNKLDEFSKSLLDFAPKNKLKQNLQAKKCEGSTTKQQSLKQFEIKEENIKIKSVIFLTPTVNPMNSLPVPDI